VQEEHLWELRSALEKTVVSNFLATRDELPNLGNNQPTNDTSKVHSTGLWELHILRYLTTFCTPRVQDPFNVEGGDGREVGSEFENSGLELDEHEVVTNPNKSRKIRKTIGKVCYVLLDVFS